MRSAGRVSRVSRILVVLGFLSLLVPAVASAGTRGQARKVKGKTTTEAKRSKEKMALQRANQGKKKQGEAKAAGFLPRPVANQAGGKKEGAAKLAGTRTASVAKSTSRARSTSKTRRPVRKTRITKKTRRPTTRRRAARTQRNRTRRSTQGLETSAAAAELAADAPDAMGSEREMGPMDGMDFDSAQPRSRFRRFLGATGRAIKKFGTYGLVIAAPAAVLAAGFTIVGGATVMGIGFAIAAPAIMLGIPMVIGLREQAAKQAMGIDDVQQEQLQRYMSRQMIENQDLNGPGPGNGVAGMGGLNTLNNMIDPGGMR